MRSCLGRQSISIGLFRHREVLDRKSKNSPSCKDSDKNYVVAAENDFFIFYSRGLKEIIVFIHRVEGYMFGFLREMDPFPYGFVSVTLITMIIYII